MSEVFKSALRLFAGLLRKAADGIDAMAGPKPVKPR